MRESPFSKRHSVSEATSGSVPSAMWGHVQLWLPTQATGDFQNCTSRHTARPAWNQPVALVELRKKHPRLLARPQGLPSVAQLHPQPLRMRPSLGLCHVVCPASGTTHLLAWLFDGGCLLIS